MEDYVGAARLLGLSQEAISDQLSPNYQNVSRTACSRLKSKTCPFSMRLDDMRTSL